MTTLYAVVTYAGYDEGTTIHGIYTTRELAEEAQRRYGADLIEEQQADVLPDLPEGKYAWAVSVMNGEVKRAFHRSIIDAPYKSYLSSHDKSGYVYCIAADEWTAVFMAELELPALLEQARKDAEKAAAKLQEDILAGRVLQVTRQMILEDATGFTVNPRSPVGMLGSMCGKRQ